MSPTVPSALRSSTRTKNGLSVESNTIFKVTERGPLTVLAEGKASVVKTAEPFSKR